MVPFALVERFGFLFSLFTEVDEGFSVRFYVRVSIAVVLLACLIAWYVNQP
eukprot:m.390358 g.390358  ORF g.390358 m.390358 type:complete len:51 (+) comp20077_c0_seq5:3146-3298(+)